MSAWVAAWLAMVKENERQNKNEPNPYQESFGCARDWSDNLVEIGIPIYLIIACCFMLWLCRDIFTRNG